MNHEIDEEQEFHISCRITELIADGMPPEQAMNSDPAIALRQE